LYVFYLPVMLDCRDTYLCNSVIIGPMFLHFVKRTLLKMPPPPKWRILFRVRH